MTVLHTSAPEPQRQHERPPDGGVARQVTFSKFTRLALAAFRVVSKLFRCSWLLLYVDELLLADLVARRCPTAPASTRRWRVVWALNPSPPSEINVSDERTLTSSLPGSEEVTQTPVREWGKTHRLLHFCPLFPSVGVPSFTSRVQAS